ncbi:unnamed protein product [Cuscuta epithymum]|uniref:Leucine-rich repeat-containing N-terminal plant-type domain-containing protein n=1 Tax=Cuscuta epithymum TaxID=186058 RepID=A0AAV0GII4_9ASTE|nr:unnamed protein product [Cuscuta epithymum]
MASFGLLLLFAAAAIAAVVRAQYGPSPDDDVLQALKSSLTFKPETSSDLSDAHPCNWISILECDVVDDLGPPRVTVLRFYEKVTSGSLPANLENLTKLDEFSASSNNLVGAIPNFADSVGYLSLEDNQFTSISPSLFHYKPNLTSVNLSNNAHLPMWEIPQGLKNSLNLEQFYAANCKLFGELPDLSNLRSLRDLDVSHNQLTGVIPLSLASLPKLTILDVSYNQLSGVIPPSLASLPKLTIVDVSHNQLSGVIPPSLASLPKLIIVDVSYNQLTGVIPPSLADLPYLETVDVSNNQLSGVIPQTLAHLPYLTKVDLSNNNLTGTVPKFGPNVTVITCGNSHLSNGRGAPCRHVRYEQRMVS